MMLEILARTPGSSSVDPPPIHLCDEVVQQFFKENRLSDDAILTSSKTVLDVVSRLLQFEWDCTKDVVKDSLENIILAAESNLKKKHKDHRDVGLRLSGALDDLEKPWRIKMREIPDTAETTEDRQPLAPEDWKNANIKWLCNPSFFSPTCCPKMRVGASGVYDSADNYMETVYRLWVAMTFADGHSALAPHCRSRGQSGGGCNNALWPITGSVGQARCRSRGCSKPVEFACRIKSHDALCSDCATRSVAQHLKGPGQSASTHVYDCKVKYVDPDGILYLNGFKSRNPPPNVHWRTSKRLSPPNLVGIVGTRSMGSPLNESDLVKWGEVVYHGHNRDEERRRQQGDLAINISSIVEIDPDFFEEHSSVAVVSFFPNINSNFSPLSLNDHTLSSCSLQIDCMSFVPEWIPVLKALESQKNSCLPFENGKHLNLCKDSAVKVSSVMDTYSSPNDLVAANRSQVIEMMVEESQLEPIREIRRDPSLRDELVTKLENLVLETTLDKMQLVSFLDALQNPVHLTQGP